MAGEEQFFPLTRPDSEAEADKVAERLVREFPIGTEVVCLGYRPGGTANTLVPWPELDGVHGQINDLDEEDWCQPFFITLHQDVPGSYEKGQQIWVARVRRTHELKVPSFRTVEEADRWLEELGKEDSND